MGEDGKRLTQITDNELGLLGFIFPIFTNHDVAC